MKKIFSQTIILLIGLLISQVGSAQQLTLSELAQGIAKMTKENPGLLSREDRLLVRRQLRNIRFIYSDYGVELHPVASEKLSHIYSCSNHTSPKLSRVIVDDMGNELRKDDIATFTQGPSTGRILACQNNLWQSNLSANLKGQCSCSNHTSPSLSIDLVNDEFQTVKSIFIKKYTIGSAKHRLDECRQMIRKLSICTGL